MIGAGLGIPAANARALFDDGRMLGRLAEFIVAHEFSAARSEEHSPFDVLHNNKKLEVRSLIKKADRGISFAPAKEVGSGRTITEEGFQEKLSQVDGFIAAELMDNDHIRYIEVTKPDIDFFVKEGYIRNSTKAVGYNTFYNIFNSHVLSSEPPCYTTDDPTNKNPLDRSN